MADTATGIERATATREWWLLRAIDELRAMFEQDFDIKLPEKIRVSLGHPSGGSRRGKTVRLAECWVRECSADKATELFVSPALSDPVKVLEALVHELIHASDNCASGHKGYFVRCAKLVGLEEPWTATHAGTELEGKLTALARKLGEFPHAALKPPERDAASKQTTRMIKCECSDCGYVARTAKKWLDLYGPPMCPCSKAPMDVA